MKKLLSLCVLWLLSIFSVNGYAYHKGIPLFWGERESIHKIVDIPLKGSKGEDLFLAYKTHSYFLLAGIYLEDDGYVIGISGNDNGYYPLPSGYKLREFREAGMLPIELPKYKITFLDYIIGYSLWIIIACIALYLFAKSLFSKPILQHKVKHKTKSIRKW